MKTWFKTTWAKIVNAYKTKKWLSWVTIIVAVAVIVLAFVIPTSGKKNEGGGINGTYYFYQNGGYVETSFFVLKSGNAWEDSDGGEGKYTLSENIKIVFYDSKKSTKLFSGEISNGVLKIDYVVYQSYFCKQGKMPDDFGKVTKPSENSSNNNTGCQHIWREAVVEDATCMETGVVISICEICEYSKTELITVKEHNYINKLCIYCGTSEFACCFDLDFDLSDDGTYYSVAGLGECEETDIAIPSTYEGLPVKRIVGGAFYDCDSLTSVVIPDSVTAIVAGAFEDCDSLTSINVSENNTEYKSIDGNLYTKDEKTLIRYAIGKQATSFTIPDSVTYIGDNAFETCESLTSVVIGESVTAIGWFAFCRCESLTSVVIGESVTAIGPYAFCGCESLTSVGV